MNRDERLCEHLNLDGVGLEIGPSYNPVLSKRTTPGVRSVDHAPREALVEKYTAYGLDPSLVDRIEPVDFVWTGGSLLDAVPDHGSYDYIVASHFIEHSVNLVLLLADCQRLLKPDGVLALAVPDKRFTFDRFKPLTSLGDVVDGAHQAARFHPAGALVDHSAYAVTKGGQVAWHDGSPGVLALQQEDLSDVPAALDAGLAQAEYVDIHRWIFTPQSFVLLMGDLRELGHHDLEVIDLEVTGGHEFLVWMRRAVGPMPVRDRLASLLAIEQEHAYVAPGARIDDPRVTRLLEQVEAQRKQIRRLRRRVRRQRRRLEEITGSRAWRVATQLQAGRRFLSRPLRHG